MRTSYKQGSIFFHKNFKFKDGQIGKKFLILLNYSADEKEYIFLKTTSNPKNKSQKECSNKPPCFFISQNQDYFEKDTWVQLHENYIFEAEKIRQNNNVIFHKNLNEKTTQSLIHCYLKIMDDDIRPNERNLIKPELNGALAQLQRKFSKNK